MAIAEPIEGVAFRLRPVGPQDVGLVVRLRNDPELSRHMPQVDPDPEAQRAYIARQQATPGDYYFAIEKRAGAAEPEGFIALYRFDTETDEAGAPRAIAEWGRWILKPGSLAALEGVVLVYRFGFTVAGRDRIYCRSIADNMKVLSFHDQCGLERRRIWPGLFEIDGEKRDAVEHSLTRERFAKVAPELDRRVARTAKLALR